MIVEFVEINFLLGVQVELAFGNGDSYGRVNYCCFDVGRYVIGAFNGVGEEGEVFWYYVVEDVFEVCMYIWVGIFIDGEGSGSVFDKQVKYVVVGQGVF